jgi:hypothetical protein
MDILYYSNFCSNSQKVVQYISKAGLIERINAICIDKRSIDPNTGQVHIQLENGKKIMLPPNVHSVPALLVVKKNYNALFGGEIIKYFEPAVLSKMKEAHMITGEPVGTSLTGATGNLNIISEQYTLYDLSPEELSAKGVGGRRPLYNYTSVAEEIFSIPTPPDTWRPDKVDQSVTIDNLTQKRDQEIRQGAPKTPYGF